MREGTHRPLVRSCPSVPPFAAGGRAAVCQIGSLLRTSYFVRPFVRSRSSARPSVCSVAVGGRLKRSTDEGPTADGLSTSAPLAPFFLRSLALRPSTSSSSSRRPLLFVVIIAFLQKTGRQSHNARQQYTLNRTLLYAIQSHMHLWL